MPQAPDTIVLVHGLFLDSRSWEGWAERYRARGTRCSRPRGRGWKPASRSYGATQRRSTKLDVTTIVDHYDQLVRELGSPPIIMGHSLGGTVTSSCSCAARRRSVGVEAATVKGILDLPLSTLKANTGVLANPFNRARRHADREAVPLRLHEHLRR